MFKGANTKTILVAFLGLGIYSGLIQLLIYFESLSDKPAITNLLEGIWYSTVTIAAVGYGDYVPYSPLGKAVGYIFVLASIFLYGYFISKLTNYISNLNNNKKMGFNGTKFKNHTVILGWDYYSKVVADQLIQVGQSVAIVTKNKENIELINEHFHNAKNVFALYSEFDNYDLLRKANIEKCNTVFVNSKDDTQKLVHVLNLKKEFSENDLKFIVTLENSDLRGTFKTAGVTIPLSKHDLSSKLVASYIFEPDVAEFGEELLSYANTDTDNDIKMYMVIDRNPYLHMPFNDAFFDLKRKYNTILIGITKVKDGERTLIKNPEHEVQIEKGDYLLLICNGKNEKEITSVFGIEEGIVH